MDCFFALVLTASNAFALSCDALLSHGMYNIRVAKSAKASVATKYDNHCHKDFSSLKNDVLATLEIEVFGYGGGEASFSKEKSEQKLTQWCKTNESLAKENQNLVEESRTIYSGAVNAWESCKKLEAKGIQIEHVISEDAQSVDIALSYDGVGIGGVEFFGVKAKGFMCDVKVPTIDGFQKNYDPNESVIIDRQAVSISCDRADSVPVVRPSGEYDALARGLISVRTAGSPYQLFFAKTVDPTIATANALALQNKISELEESHQNFIGSFNKSVVGFRRAEDCPFGWKPYQRAQGRFLRGIDLTGETNIDPAGKRNPGNHQNEQYAEHRHGLGSNYAGAGPKIGSAFVLNHHPNAHLREGAHMTPQGGNETRPDNVAVLYCTRG